jgi:hypothetical protein
MLKVFAFKESFHFQFTENLNQIGPLEESAKYQTEMRANRNEEKICCRDNSIPTD